MLFFDQERRKRRRKDLSQGGGGRAKQADFLSLFPPLALLHNSSPFFFCRPFVPRLSQQLRHGFLRPGTSLVIMPSRDRCAGRNGRGSAVAAPTMRGGGGVVIFCREQRKTKRKTFFSFVPFGFLLTLPDRPPRGPLDPSQLPYSPASIFL